MAQNMNIDLNFFTAVEREVVSRMPSHAAFAKAGVPDDIIYSQVSMDLINLGSMSLALQERALQADQHRSSAEKKGKAS